MNGLGRRPDGENRDEPGGIATCGSVGAGEKQRAEGGGCGEVGGGELPAGEAVVEEVSGGRGQGAEASQCGTSERTSQAGEISAAGDEAGTGEVRGRRGRGIWADAGGGTFGQRRWDADRRGDVAAVDAGGRAVEEEAEAETVSAAAGATAALWGVGADGRKFSRLVGGARSGRLPDEHDRRCDQRGGVAAGRGGDDLGGGEHVAGVDRKARSAAGAVCGLEERVKTRAHA